MERKIITTSDGSKSLYLPDWDESYHSKHGAIQEAYHVFIRNGLDQFRDNRTVSVLEMGFGTGLNCFISWLEAQRRGLNIHYHGLEAFPLEVDLTKEMEYPKSIGENAFETIFNSLHEAKWNTKIEISPGFELYKDHGRFEEFDLENRFDLIYFDAFGPRVQPDLWTSEIFDRMYKGLKEEGILVTYSAKGSVRRAMQEVGFSVERLPGPPGKREMLRAVKG